ncbi:MAG: N-acetylmuramoyl-L-alanine amidase [Candidatus Marinimicrobia bacterium]|jgi:N-acetylmuramoyl-L-alanine amidase|nr:N-acetylmuramoyl-L-alanine amidase [Candidatus Neomarinimicrobiota bacterium]MBT3944417.1 N-acetylmuramoyl-L-alanine amidase [Candidatus Neomarinimicrobiota bacterium]MBT4111880.1 N-acetylmuramoyl-L-alanine amidase [Candidatus Neomarinimicrobiota bacterium]MBT4706416.1 N-acetylmuramoyl-L-alanine amidase [Candidatus Neomarinimicrobiota bacterium]MBT4926465.1 N-acetylmuramoyl-L-alanine amidase [Candidatus Neomarinimicrobiota bacterium]
MRLLISLYRILPLFFLLSIVVANNQQSITVLGANNNILGKADLLKKDQYYLSVNDFGSITGGGFFVNDKTKKIVIYIDGLKVKLSQNIAFIVIDDKIYQMQSKLIKSNDEYYVPIDDFFNILSIHGSGHQSIDYTTMSISLNSKIKNTKEIPAVNVDLTKEKNRWKLDTIIIDPGHGGKDPGAIGYRGTKEKDITLDVAKRLVKKIERNMNINTILTRDEDIFIRLEDRTKLANSNNGKLFISIHANSAEDRRANGFETYMIGMNKNAAAVRTAARENAVLDLEGGSTTKLTDEALIKVTIAQSGFANGSEKFAALVQEEMNKRLQSKDRGIKQAGFYVLAYASMPNVLIELGYISNPAEEKKLKSSQYRDILATSIYRAIERYQQTLDTN